MTTTQPLPLDDAGRQPLLRALHKLGTAPEEELDTLVRLVARHLRSNRAWLAIVGPDATAQLKAQVGLNTSDLAPAETLQLIAALHATDRTVQRLDGHEFFACRVIVQQHFAGVLCVSQSSGSSFDADAGAVLLDHASLAGTLLDIRLKEKLWRRQAEVVRVASMSSSDWIWESDEHGHVRWVSSGVETHTGLRPSSVIGRGFQQINEPLEDDHSRSWERYQEARAQRQPFRDVLARRPSPSGSIIVSMSGLPVFDAAGNFKGYRGTTSNVTERVQAQRAARAAHQLLNDALDSLTAAVMISDPEGRVVLSNAAWRRNLGPYMADGELWPEVVRRVATAGDYPAAADQEAFVQWRLGIATARAEQHEMRWKDRWVIVSDRLLADGSVVHLSIDITDRKEAELTLARQQEQLRESQGQLTAVLNAVPDLWFVLDAEGRYLACSSATHPMLVHSWESVKGKPFSAGVPGPVADSAIAAIRRALETGELQRIDYDLTTADGVNRNFEARISPMPHRQVLYVTRDLTELRTLERDLLIMQRALEAEASLAICVADATQPDLPLIYVNPAFERLTGYSRTEALGRNCRFLQAHLRDQPGCTPLREAIAQGRSASVTLNNVRKDGTVFANALHVAPVRNAGGQLTHYIGVQRDVTEQTRAADKLRLSEELYRSVALAISDGLLVVTPALGIIAINPAGCEILGVEQAEMMGSASGPWPFELLGQDETPLPADA
ncbi:MAG: PAS domain S-box protein, partial [Rhizobacter sp.]